MAFDSVQGACEDTAFAVKKLFLGPYRVRRVQLYGVGIGKSGTHSIAKMFSHRVRTRHEPQAAQLIDKIINWRKGRIGEQEITDWLRTRDRALALEIDSSGLNLQILDILLREFPKALFVLAIRDCYSWVNSRMNGDISGHQSGPWFEWSRFLYGDGPFVYAPKEEALKNRNLCNLDTYFSSWATRNRRVLDQVPPERLFVVRTDQIRDRAFELADFAGLPRRVVRLHRTHEFKNSRKLGIIREIDREFLERKVEQHCRPLMTRFFPEIKSLDDTRL